MTIPGSPRQKCAVANLRTLSARTSLPGASTDPQTANTFLCRDYRPTDWAEADVIPPDAKADVIPPELNSQGRAQIHRPRHAVHERCPSRWTAAPASSQVTPAPDHRFLGGFCPQHEDERRDPSENPKGL